MSAKAAAYIKARVAHIRESGGGRSQERTDAGRRAAALWLALSDEEKRAAERAYFEQIGALLDEVAPR